MEQYSRIFELRLLMESFFFSSNFGTNSTVIDFFFFYLKLFLPPVVDIRPNYRLIFKRNLLMI
jgi:hypothetical protein